MDGKNKAVEREALLKASKDKLENEKEDMVTQLEASLAKQQIDIKELTEKLVAEKVAEVQRKFDEERNQMEGFLQAKISKNLQLEVLLDEMKDAYRALEKDMSGDDRALR